MRFLSLRTRTFQPDTLPNSSSTPRQIPKSSTWDMPCDELIQEAVEDLNALGLNYRLISGTVAGENKRAGKGRLNKRVPRALTKSDRPGHRDSDPQILPLDQTTQNRQGRRSAVPGPLPALRRQRLNWHSFGASPAFEPWSCDAEVGIRECGRDFSVAGIFLG
jgi:hypothetical protein